MAEEKRGSTGCRGTPWLASLTFTLYHHLIQSHIAAGLGSGSTALS